MAKLIFEFLQPRRLPSSSQILVGKPERKILLGRPRRRWEDIIKIDIWKMDGRV
jgi:hypothetical protein